MSFIVSISRAHGFSAGLVLRSWASRPRPTTTGGPAARRRAAASSTTPRCSSRSSRSALRTSSPPPTAPRECGWSCAARACALGASASSGSCASTDCRARTCDGAGATGPPGRTRHTPLRRTWPPRRRRSRSVDRQHRRHLRQRPGREPVVDDQGRAHVLAPDNLRHPRRRPARSGPLQRPLVRATRSAARRPPATQFPRRSAIDESSQGPRRVRRALQQPRTTHPCGRTARCNCVHHARTHPVGSKIGDVSLTCGFRLRVRTRWSVLPALAGA
jgi:hypothetical protein